MKIMSAYKKQFQYYKELTEKTIDQLEEKDLFWQYSPYVNSIAIIVNHITGNMLSRWTDFRTSDGEKTWRHRDKEFEDALKSKKDILQIWQKAWDVFEKALNSVTDEELENIIYIRSQGHTIREAINRQLAHYPYHIGQIVYLGKMIKGQKWQSLSIPPNQSQSYNDNQNAKGKRIAHYTDDLLDKN